MPHRFQIKPETVPATEYVYVILHEFAHYLHREFMTGAKLNAAWIRLFNTSIKLLTIKRDQSMRLLTALIQGEEKPSDFKSGLDDENKLAFNWIIRTIKADHAISLAELDILFEADFKDEIEALWPDKTLNKKDLAPIVSEYATTSPPELIAESFAFHLTKRSLPAPITKLMEKSISYARAKAGAT